MFDWLLGEVAGAWAFSNSRAFPSPTYSPRVRLRRLVLDYKHGPPNGAGNEVCGSLCGAWEGWEGREACQGRGEKVGVMGAIPLLAC
jgi:hypothetical protein